jgi:membrane protease YdiL (CAAX protease family)
MKKRLISFTSLDEKPPWKWFVFSLLLFLALLPGLEWLVSWNADLNFPASIKEQFKVYHDNNMKIYAIMLNYNTGIDLTINLLVMALLPAVAEELLFRGLLLRIFKKMFGNIHGAIWLTALVFAFIHMQPYNIVPMVIMAAIFGYAYYFTGSLWVPIGLHFLNNASYILMKNQEIADDAMTTGPMYTIGFVAVGILLFVYMMKKSPKPKTLSIE